MRLRRLVTMRELELAYQPGVVVAHVVNAMREHFRPVEDMVTLKVRVVGKEHEHGFLEFTMELEGEQS